MFENILYILKKYFLSLVVKCKKFASDSLQRNLCISKHRLFVLYYIKLILPQMESQTWFEGRNTKRIKQVKDELTLDEEKISFDKMGKSKQ